MNDLEAGKYSKRGVSSSKNEVHSALQESDKACFREHSVK